MTVDDDTPEIDDEWQFGDWAGSAATEGGGGLLQQLLDEVTAMRNGAKADRIALADAIGSSFVKVELQMAELRDEITSVRADLEAFRDAALEVQALGEEAVAAQREATVQAVVAGLDPKLAALRKAVPTADMARVALEMSRLRTALIGPG